MNSRHLSTIKHTCWLIKRGSTENCDQFLLVSFMLPLDQGCPWTETGKIYEKPKVKSKLHLEEVEVLHICPSSREFVWSSMESAEIVPSRPSWQTRQLPFSSVIPTGKFNRKTKITTVQQWRLSKFSDRCPRHKRKLKRWKLYLPPFISFKINCFFSSRKRMKSRIKKAFKNIFDEKSNDFEYSLTHTFFFFPEVDVSRMHAMQHLLFWSPALISGGLEWKVTRCSPSGSTAQRTERERFVPAPIEILSSNQI